MEKWAKTKQWEMGHIKEAQDGVVPTSDQLKLMPNNGPLSETNQGQNKTGKRLCKCFQPKMLG